MNQVTPEILTATPRDTSRRDWLRHAGTLATTFALSAAATRAWAQDAPATPDAMPADSMTVGAATTQAMPQNSIVPDAKVNPNNPATTIPKTAAKATPGDVEILNFALGLEYLEADFYARIVAAHQARPYLPQRVYEVAQKLAADEAAHVQAILEILTTAKATPVNKPQFQFPDNVFYVSLAFLDLATTFEETGVGAYLGAAPQVKSRDALRFAASVYGIETRHTGLIRLLNGTSPSPSATEMPLTVGEVTQRVAPFIIGT